MREPVAATTRAAMTKARRLRLYMACNGRCECGAKVPMEGTTIDHRIQLWMGGSDTDDNLRFFCGPCDKPKTAKDATVRAKADPDTRPRSKRPLQSRGFQSNLTTGFDGKVRQREQRA